jgi:hypothetical protein
MLQSSPFKKWWFGIWGSYSDGYEELCLCVVSWKSTNASEEHVATIFRVEEEATQFICNL